MTKTPAFRTCPHHGDVWPEEIDGVPQKHVAVICSWCNKWMRCKNWAATTVHTGTSHGICDACAKTQALDFSASAMGHPNDAPKKDDTEK